MTKRAVKQPPSRCHKRFDEILSRYPISTGNEKLHGTTIGTMSAECCDAVNGGLPVFYRNLEKLLKNDRQDETNYVTIPKEIFRRLLAGAIRSKNMFDERFYVEFYPDIAAAIRGRRIKTGLEHYLQAGYFENRLPRKLLVDESYYLQQYPDVADAIRKGKLKNAQDHFNNAGFNEGRLPYKDFSLF